ncbi:hypothetical protein [Flavobacterium sp.]
MMKNSTLFIFTAFLLLAFSCQEEGEKIVTDTANNFTKDSPIALLISRVSQYETSKDNVLDGTSNCSVKLPVHLTVNGSYVNVRSSADFQAVEDIKNQSNTDDDIVHFVFPITLIYPNHQEQTVANQSQFDTILAGFGDDSAFRETSCMNFNYPFSINYYNTDNQIGSTIIVDSDIELYNFVQNLTVAQVVGIVFPITVTNDAQQQVTIANGGQLEDIINLAVANCSDSVQPVSLADVLTDGTWRISYCFHEGDQTAEYVDFRFVFHSDGDITVTKNAIVFDGDWDIHSGSPQRLDLNFDGSLLHDIESNWDVQEFTPTYIRLREHGGGDGSQSYYLSFTKV